MCICCIYVAEDRVSGGAEKEAGLAQVLLEYSPPSFGRFFARVLVLEKGQIFRVLPNPKGFLPWSFKLHVFHGCISQY